MDDNGIFIVEDELITANGIADLLVSEGFIVRGIAVDASAALKAFKNSNYPRVVLCDINIKGEVNGIELAKELKKLYACEIIFLTAYADNKTLYNAFGADPVMYIVKPFNDKQLLTAVHMAFHKIIQKEGKEATQEDVVLTKREREIAELLIQGYTSRQIAKHLFISEQTVKTHRKSMLLKNNIHNVAQLIYLMNR